MKIIGIGGLTRSGKDTLAEMLVAKGYFGVSLGDIVREQSRKRHAGEADPISVANMTETANHLRQHRGPDFALQEAVRQFQSAGGETEYRGLLVYSVRAPAEADYVLKNGGQLIWLQADDRIRYQRAKQYRREGEAEISFDEFQRQEMLQARPQPGLSAEAQMNAEYVRSKATLVLTNDSNDMEEFKAAVQQALDL